MPRFGPISRSDFIRTLRAAGWEGPFSGGKHEYMVKGALRLIVPNPHGTDIDRSFLNRLLRQAGMSRDEWEKL